jgi:hypothetical protein
MASKYLGLGTTFKVDEDDSGTVHTTITLCVDGTPPARKRVRIDATGLTDTLSTYKMGMEDFSEFSFTQYWDPIDTQHASLDTLFGAKTVVEWQIVYTSGETDEFEGFVSALEPQPVVKDQLLTRKVTVQRKTATTRTVA